MKKILLLPLLFMIHQAKAATSVSANISGTIKVELMTEDHFRHSLECYPMKKASKTHKLAPQTLALKGGTQEGSSGTFKWTSVLVTPFPRHIRDVILTSSTAIEESGEKVTIELKDNYTYSVGQFTKSSCSHTDGMANPLKAQIEGNIKISYTVPENIWAVRVLRQGTGILVHSNMQPIQGALNHGFDKNVDAEEIIWVKPGSRLTQEIVFPQTIPGSAELGSATITFKPITGAISTEESQTDAIKQINKFALAISDGNSSTKISEKDTHQFIEYSMGIVANNVASVNAQSKMTTQQIANTSKTLFTIANSTIPSAKLGLPVKTAAALASYEMAMKILTDLSGYCETVEIYFPMKDQKIQVLGLRAAGFWLTRGLASVKNYRFTEYQAFVEQLASFESEKVTYADIRKNREAAKKIQEAFAFLTDNIDVGGSPFGSALKDVQRTLKQFGSIGAHDAETAALIKSLTDLSRLESQFVRELFASLDLFTTSSPEIVKGHVFLNQLKTLKAAQQQISNNMEKNIRLLSIDGGSDSTSAMNVILNLLSHQIAIFEMPLNSIPYFEPIRSEYLNYKNRGHIIEKAKHCLRGGY